jgi:hypothetical protein
MPGRAPEGIVREAQVAAADRAAKEVDDVCEHPRILAEAAIPRSPR